MRSANGGYADLPGDGGMTLEEIALREGVSRTMIWSILQSAYRKLRRDRVAIEHLRALAEISAAQRLRGRSWMDEESEL